MDRARERGLDDMTQEKGSVRLLGGSAAGEARPRLANHGLEVAKVEALCLRAISGNELGCLVGPSAWDIGRLWTMQRDAHALGSSTQAVLSAFDQKVVPPSPS